MIGSATRRHAAGERPNASGQPLPGRGPTRENAGMATPLIAALSTAVDQDATLKASM